ncbi:MAG: hypothetical protein KC561_04620, partial [Myxococcales bacterium]|nr:hypothetical protein [Myxococcales bacterium]
MQSQVRDARNLEQAGSYRAAFEAYEEALRQWPSSDDAAEGYARTLPLAVDEILLSSQVALEQGDFELAIREANRVRAISPGETRASRAIEDVAGEMENLWESSLSRGDVSGAFATLQRAEPLVGRARVQAGYDQASQSALSLALQFAERAAFDDALGWVQVVARRNPSAPRLAETEAAVRHVWAEYLGEEASQALEADSPVEALFLYARAVEVSHGEEGLDNLQGLQEQLAEEAFFDISVGSTGGPDASFISQISGVREVTRDSDLAITFYPSDNVCSESSTLETRQHNYVAGYREVPNPLYYAARDDLERAETRSESERLTIRQAVDRITELQGAVAGLEYEVEEVRRDVASLQGEQTSAQNAFNRAERALDQCELRVVQSTQGHGSAPPGHQGDDGGQRNRGDRG